MSSLPPLQTNLGDWFALFARAVAGVSPSPSSSRSKSLSPCPTSPSTPPSVVGDNHCPGAEQEHITAPGPRGPPLRILSPGSAPGDPIVPGILLRAPTLSPPPVDFSTKPKLYLSPTPLAVSPSTDALLRGVYPDGVPFEVLPNVLPEVVTQGFITDNFPAPEAAVFDPPLRTRSTSFASDRSFDSTAFGAITLGPLSQPFRDFTYGSLFEVQSHVATLRAPGEIQVFKHSPHRLLLYDGDDYACCIVLSHRFHKFPGVSSRLFRDPEDGPYLTIYPSTWTFPDNYEFLVEVDEGVGYIMTGA